MASKPAIRLKPRSGEFVFVYSGDDPSHCREYTPPVIALVLTVVQRPNGENSYEYLVHYQAPGFSGSTSPYNTPSEALTAAAKHAWPKGAPNSVTY